MGKISQDLDTFRMPVDLKIETEGNPEEKRVEVVGTSSEFVVDTFGKPKNIVIDPGNKVLRYSPDVRVAVAEADLSVAQRVDPTEDAIEFIARHLSALPGRKSLVWMSAAGIPLSIASGSSRDGALGLHAR